MMGIVVDIDEFLLFNTVIEAAAYTRKSLQPIAQLVVIQSTHQSHSACRHCIFDIEKGRPVKLKVIQYAVGCTQVEKQVTIISAYVDGIVVGIDAVGGISGDIRCETWDVRMLFVMVMLMTVFDESFTVEGAEDAFFQ